MADAIHQLPEENAEKLLVETGMVRDLLQALRRRDLRLGELPQKMIKQVNTGLIVSPVFVRNLSESLKWKREIIELYDLDLPGISYYHKFILDEKVLDIYIYIPNALLLHWLFYPKHYPWTCRSDTLRCGLRSTPRAD